MATTPISTRQLNSLQSAEGLQEYLLKGVKRNGRQLGNGVYGIVEELEVNGVVVAGKKLHETLVDPSNLGAYNVGAQFVKECNIMSRLRHPHIVQFLGIYFQERAPFPVLVMEYLPHSLDAVLEQRLNIATSVKVSFLYDVAKGLAYLHGQDPPIIHRDLTARNILLNSAMVAKIADFFPKDLLPPTYLSYERPQVLLLRTEVERRERYYEVAYCLLDETNPAHKLVKLSELCLCNDPPQRPTVDLLITVLQELCQRLPDPFLAKDKLELMELAVERSWHMEGERVRELQAIVAEQRQQLAIQRSRLTELEEETVGQGEVRCSVTVLMTKSVWCILLLLKLSTHLV